MKKILTALFILISAAAFSQGKMNEQQKEELKAKMQEYRTSLNLTEEQTPKVEAINKKYFEGLAALRDSDAGKLAKYRKLKELGKEKDREMKAVLNADQYKKYLAFQQEMKEEMKEKRKG
ncbi:MAG: hypothetical protein ACO1NW_02900 [Chitinophagaceae bacterium]